ncbi:MAG TPA: hypothetical protein VGJ48_20225 [Pyrinomonadaceae bacterium]
MPHSTLAAPLNYRTVSGSDRMLHSTPAALLNYRTVSGSDRLVSGTLSIVGRRIRNGERPGP